MRKRISRAERSKGHLPTATGGIARLAYAHAEKADIALDSLLNDAEITRVQIEGTGPIKVINQIKFLNLVAQAMNDELLGFHLAEAAEFRELGLLYYVLASSDVLIDALTRAARYGSIVNECVSQKCIDQQDALGMSFRYKGVSRHLDRHQIEFWMAALVRICRQLTGLRMLPTKVRFVHRRMRTVEFSEILGDKIEFGTSVDEITFSPRFRNTPVVSADRYLNNLLISYCESAVSDRARSQDPFQVRVENAIAPLLPHGKATVGEIAPKLGVSSRTLTRRLAKEGHTFSGLVTGLRRDLGGRYLGDGDLPISEIAWLLGYREVASFSNAFKRWTGKTPREVRNAGLLKGAALQE